MNERFFILIIGCYILKIPAKVVCCFRKGLYVVLILVSQVSLQVLQLLPMFTLQRLDFFFVVFLQGLYFIGCGGAVLKRVVNESLHPAEGPCEKIYHFS